MTANRYTIAPHISSIAPVVKVLDGPIGLVLNAGVGSWFMVHGSWFLVHSSWLHWFWYSRALLKRMSQ
jgi:hypothetical protein